MSEAISFAFDWKLLAGTLLCFVGGAVSAGGGIGGGAFYLAAFILILGMDAHAAVPLSKVTIFGLAIGGLLVLIRERHPKDNTRFLIDFNMALLLLPNILLGTVLGVLLNVISPTWLIVVFLVFIFGITSYRTIKKGFEHRAAEKAAELKAAATAIAVPQDEPEDLPQQPDTQVKQDLDVAEESPVPDSGVETRRRALIEVGKKVGLMLLMWGMMFVFLALKLSSECGSLVYWGFIVAVCPLLIACTCGIAWWLRKQESKRTKELLPGDLVYSWAQVLGLVFGGMGAGFFSAFLGIGGGIMIGPLLLSLGIMSQVATATSSFMLVFTSASSSAQYILMGKLQLYFALWYVVIGFTSALVGQKIFLRLIKKSGKQSFVDFLLASIVVLSVVAMSILLVYQLYTDISNNTNLTMRPFCPSSSTPLSPFDSESSF